MSNDVYQALRLAVNIARNEQTRSVAALKARMSLVIKDEAAINDALLYWAAYERRKPA